MAATERTLNCPRHGLVELESAEYLRQLEQTGPGWTCPLCDRPAEWVEPDGVSPTAVDTSALETSVDNICTLVDRLRSERDELLAALKAVLERRPELWGDHVVNGITEFPIEEAALFAADSAIACVQGRPIQAAEADTYRELAPRLRQIAAEVR